MKKTILPIIIFVIIFMANIVYADTATKAEVNATAVRIREKASLESNIITNVYKEDVVEILEDNGEWYKVQYEDSIGYAKSEFFTIISKGETLNNQAEVTESQQEDSKPITTPAEQQNEEIPEKIENTQLDDNTTQNINTDYSIGESITLNNNISVRVIPSLSASYKNEILSNTQISIEDKKGSWYKINDGSVFGWITKSKLNSAVNQVAIPEVVENTPEVTQPEVNSVQENIPEEPVTENVPENTTAEEETIAPKTAIVIVETARVRKSASKTSDIIDTLDEDDIVNILSEEGEFYKISTSSIKEGYIAKSLVKDYKVTSRGSNEERENTVSIEENNALNDALSETNSSLNSGESIIEFAKQYLGYPYVLGASSPEKGFDCSGFTRYVFGHFGYKLGQVAAEQTSLGSVVERGNLITGDLLLFYNESKSKIGHCGIYIGGGDFIHSANPERGVVIDNLNTNSYYSQRFVTARRIVE